MCGRGGERKREKQDDQGRGNPGHFDHLTVRTMVLCGHESVLDSTHVQRKTLPGAAAIPTIKVRLNGELTHVRWQETETPARAESAARRSKISEQHTGAADPHSGRIHSSA